MDPDKITFRPRSNEDPEPNIREKLPSREDQGMFEQLLLQQRDALRRTIEDLGASITSYEARIVEHEEMIQEAKRKLEHIDGLIA